MPKPNRKRSSSEGAAWERCLSRGKTQRASQKKNQPTQERLFQKRMAKPALASHGAEAAASRGCSEHPGAVEARQAAGGGLYPGCGFYAEDEGVNEITAVPGSQMQRVISQL